MAVGSPKFSGIPKLKGRKKDSKRFGTVNDDCRLLIGGARTCDDNDEETKVSKMKTNDAFMSIL